MLFTGKMSYMQTIILEKDFQKTIDLLGESGWVEIKRGDSERKDQLMKMYEIVETIEKKIIDLTDFFEIPPVNDNGALKDISNIESYINDIHGRILPYKEQLAELFRKKREIENNIKDIEQFKNLNISIEELKNFQFIHFFSGSMTSEEADQVKAKLGDRVVIAKIETDFYILFTSRKGRWSLESELKRVNFQEKTITMKSNGLPTHLFVELQGQLAEVEKKMSEIKEFRDNLLKKEGNKLTENIMSFNLQKIYQGVYQSIQHSESISLFEGWILAKKVPVLVKKMRNILGDNFSFVSYEADELDEVKDGTLKVPVQLENIKPLKPFESLIYTYGVPSYKSFDPTVLFTVSFLLFFGIMFGDMGQGLIICLTGFLITRFSKEMRNLGYVIMCSGLVATIFGFLYGSMFCFEHEEIKGFMAPIYGVFNIKTPYVLLVSQGNIMQVFIIVIFIGMTTNLTGMLLNLINGVMKKKIVDILFAANGLAGFIFLASIAVFSISFALPAYFGIKFSLDKTSQNILLWVIIACMVFIFLKEPLVGIFKKHKPIFHDGVVMGIFFCFIELYEAVMTTVSNNLSFIRLGAFALSHIILSSTIMLFAGKAGGVGTVGGIITLVIGNIIIIGLEGMIVMIQTVRLEYYEFFSKFFNEFGKQFIPFKIDKRK
jgi:V/A-type H+/Na+-transporting ATPase subunit I